MPAKKEKKVLPAQDPSIIVGIGASAGGVEALKTMLGALPKKLDFSIIIVLHIQPLHKGILEEVVSTFTHLTVREIKQDDAITAGQIYIASGTHYVGLSDGKFQLSSIDSPSSRPNTIDRFFSALARDQQERAVGILLSGTGNDGSVGAKEISRRGGMVLAQAPSTAQAEEMPQNAIDAGVVDHSLAPVNLVEEILAYSQHMQQSGEKDRFEELRAQIDEALPDICTTLLTVTGHNFRHYKVSTITRRIQRRIQVLRLDSVQDYKQLLKKDEMEVRYLFNDLLIGVTAFFRDADAFDALSKEVFPALFKNHKAGSTIRIWAPGCATGKEAYTLAMLVTEYLDGVQEKPDVQIFATDIDEEALGIARQGAYSSSIAEEVSPERLKRFFIKKAQHYHINKHIRGMVLFSLHNLINDPPFSKLDLICCRNLLIYFGSHLQKKLIPLFHYALNSGGYLFLGPSENLSSHRELFRPVNPRHRISVRLPTAASPLSLFTGRSGPPTMAKAPNALSSNETDTYFVMQRIVLDEFAPKSMVIDEDGQIICASGNLEKYLAVTSGAFHNNAMRLVREGLRVGLRTALAEALKIRRQVTHTGLSLRTKEGLQRVSLVVQPMPQMGNDSGLFMIVFQDVGLPIRDDAPSVDSSVPTEETTALIEQLERELLTTREDLERTVQDLEAVNEELKSSNEELLSMNEELQSANEELETSKEEVQAANDTLSQVNTDLENLLASTQIGTIFLDNETLVRRVTPSVSRIYNLMPSDVGRPLSHFTHHAKNMPPLPALKDIYAAGKPIEHEVELQDGTWFLRRIVPYRDSEGEKEGILVMFTDISDRRHSEINFRMHADRLRLVLAASKFGVLTWNMKDDMITLSPRAMDIFGITQSSVPFQLLRELSAPEDRQRIEESLKYSLDHKIDYMIEYRINRPDGNQIWVLSTGHGEYDEQGKAVGMTRLVQDITERKLNQERLMTSEKLYRAIGESINYGIWICDRDGKNTYASPSFLELVGLTQEQCSEFGWGDLLDPEQSKNTIAAWKKCVQENWDVWDREHRFKGKDGKWHHILARGVPVRNEKSELLHWVGINLDISNLKEAEEDLRHSEQRFRSMANNAPVFIWISDAKKNTTWFNRPWLQFTGRTMEQETGRGWTENVHPDDRNHYREISDKAFNAREPFRLEYRLRRHDGEYRWLTDIGIPMFDGEGKFNGYIGSCMDITEHKEITETLKEADYRKDEFLATLAHELRNPLAPLSNGLQVIRMAASRPELFEQVRGMMERQITHMVRLVDDLLDVSRITRGLITLQKQRVDIQSVLASALELSRPLIDAKEQQFQEAVPDKPVYVMADTVRLSQVVSNLLNNASKYTQNGGKITLSVSQKAKDVIISVKDNGMGIPADMLSKIFDVFVQVDTAIDRSQGGLGIGLTLVRKLVELHGGSIEGKSKGPGKGSEFILTLPVSDK